MDWNELLQAVLVPAFVVLLNWFFALIGFNAGSDLANSLATLIVAWLLSLFTVKGAKALRVPGIR